MPLSTDLVTCPYNRCHQIRPDRIQYHLVKCSKQHPEADMVVCPYNASHHVKREEEAVTGTLTMFCLHLTLYSCAQMHVRHCTDREVIELQKFRSSITIPGQHGCLENPPTYGSAALFRQRLREVYSSDSEDDGAQVPPSNRRANRRAASPFTVSTSE